MPAAGISRLLPRFGVDRRWQGLWMGPLATRVALSLRIHACSVQCWVSDIGCDAVRRCGIGKFDPNSAWSDDLQRNVVDKQCPT